MNSTNTIFNEFYSNSSTTPDKSRASVCISLEEFEELVSYKNKYFETQDELADLESRIEDILANAPDEVVL